MIEIYPNKLAPAPVETHYVERRISLLEWFRSNGMPTDLNPADLPMSAFINGARIAPERWASVGFGRADLVQIYREPKGLDEIYIHSMIIFKAAKAVLSALTPKMPSLNNRNTKTCLLYTSPSPRDS